MILLKGCTQYVSTFGKSSSGHRTGKGPSSPQFPRRAKECSNYQTVTLISHASKVMLKILQVRFQHYVKLKTSRSSSWIRKGRGTRDQTVNNRWIIEKARKFQKNIYLCFIDYSKGFDCMDHNKLWKTVREVGIPDHPTCLLRNLYAGQEATVRTRYEQQAGLKFGKGFVKAVFCHLTY